MIDILVIIIYYDIYHSEGERCKMQVNYESICWIEKNNLSNSVLFQPLDFGQSLMKQYVMWIWLNELKFDLTLKNRTNFLKQYLLESSTDIVLNILESDKTKEEQSVVISFYYLKDEEIDQIYEMMNKAESEVKRLYGEVKEIYHKQEKNLLERIKDPNYIKNLVNISFSEGITIIPYISLVDNKRMDLHYEEGRGVILALGYEFELEKIQSYDHHDTLNKLKAIGDETRLRIVELILEKYMSASELSLSLNLTIPTIAHHLKVLLSAGVISTFIEDGGSKVTYKIYNPGIDKLIQNINILNSGGAK